MIRRFTLLLIFTFLWPSRHYTNVTPHRLFALIFVTLHLLFIQGWRILPERYELQAERYAVTIAITIAFLSYCVLALAYWRARKTKLNTSLAFNKGYWALLIGLLILPGQWGALIRDAPYRISARNPYSYWTAPPSIRTYLWVCLALTTLGVLYQFGAANDWFRSFSPEEGKPTMNTKTKQAYIAGIMFIVGMFAVFVYNWFIS